MRGKCWKFLVATFHVCLHPVNPNVSMFWAYARRVGLPLIRTSLFELRFHVCLLKLPAVDWNGFSRKASARPLVSTPCSTLTQPFIVHEGFSRSVFCLHVHYPAGALDDHFDLTNFAWLVPDPFNLKELLGRWRARGKDWRKASDVAYKIIYFCPQNVHAQTL